jgi:hypothetical protein
MVASHTIPQLCSTKSEKVISFVYKIKHILFKNKQQKFNSNINKDTVSLNVHPNN